MNNRRFFGPVGLVSLGVSFALVVMAIFSVTSLTKARAELSRAVTVCDAKAAFYLADAEAAHIARALEAAYSEQRLESCAEEYACTVRENLVSYGVPLDDRQVLAVTLRFDGEMEILSWRVENTQRWNPSDAISVWTGGN
ncbi:MAG: hypothetical protein IKL89_03320 [Clostridia bacterium]|nr:hypothetical protein [Clostridia bacterium]